MEVSEKLQTLFEDMRQRFGAERFYLIDAGEQPTDTTPGTLVFGMRNGAISVLQARLQTAEILKEKTNQGIAVEIFTDPFDEVEYLFDRYLRAYIASHGGVVTPVRIEEDQGKLWINMDGGCSGCPASLGTLKHGIERTLKKHLPWVIQVEPTNEPIEPDFGIKINFSTGATKEEKIDAQKTG